MRHFTATVIVTNTHNEVLLLWHERLQSWLPPGGHIEENEIPEEAAIRECKEETGLDIEIIGDWDTDVFMHAKTEGRMQKKPLMMQVQHIPAYPVKNQAAHEHLDFTFLGKLLCEADAKTMSNYENNNVQWFTKEAILSMQIGTDILQNVQALVLYALQKNSK